MKMRVLMGLIFIGGIILACFSYNNPLGMMSQSASHDWEASNQTFLAGFLPGLIIGMAFIFLLFQIPSRKSRKESKEHKKSESAEVKSGSS